MLGKRNWWVWSIMVFLLVSMTSCPPPQLIK